MRAVASPNGHSNTDNRRDLQSADGRFAVFASMASRVQVTPPVSWLVRRMSTEV